MSFRGIPVLCVAIAGVTVQAQTAPMRTWKDPALQLSFSYPAELQPRDAASVGGGGCAKVLLVAALGTDPNQPGASETAPASGEWASLSLSDMGPDCIPARVQKKTKAMDQMMSGLTGSPTQILGLMPIEQPIGYLLEGHHAYVAAAQGEPVSTDVVQPANGAEVLAIIAVHMNDHVLIWRLASNDAHLVNRMLSSMVVFGSGAPQALYPGHIGE
ncbi:MAG TPA: hypothetical protein VME18_00895 [Acidobacteriaceae bacterium]|nr:hypothetical protein [Acidobacteriaceae bacterium]